VDVALDASVTIEADPLGIVPTASFAVAASLGDAIASALMKRKNFSETDYAITHPAGQLGRNLILKVEDVMHKPNKIACVMEKTSIKDVVLKMSTFPLGAACVIGEDNDLVGVITDGDLRRALQKFEDIRDIEAKQIMTPKPITISPDISLGEALKEMEDRKSQVSILPVVENLKDSILGLIRIHDIYDPGKV
jgi:arabinose-5-phosphate isomerase